MHDATWHRTARELQRLEAIVLAHCSYERSGRREEFGLCQSQVAVCLERSHLETGRQGKRCTVVLGSLISALAPMRNCELGGDSKVPGPTGVLLVYGRAVRDHCGSNSRL
jgi:hypothetical protein